MSSNLARALGSLFFPSWRFFDEVGHWPRLSVRIASKDRDFGPWRPITLQSKRSLGRLFINDEGSFALAENTLLERALFEISACDPSRAEAFSQSVTYRLIERLVRSRLADDLGESPVRFQFKLSATLPNTPVPASEDVLLSLEHEV